MQKNKDKKVNWKLSSRYAHKQWEYHNPKKYIRSPSHDWNEWMNDLKKIEWEFKVTERQERYWDYYDDIRGISDENFIETSEEDSEDDQIDIIDPDAVFEDEYFESLFRHYVGFAGYSIYFDECDDLCEHPYLIKTRDEFGNRIPSCEDEQVKHFRFHFYDDDLVDWNPKATEEFVLLSQQHDALVVEKYFGSLILFSRSDLRFVNRIRDRNFKKWLYCVFDESKQLTIDEWMSLYRDQRQQQNHVLTHRT